MTAFPKPTRAPKARKQLSRPPMRRKKARRIDRKSEAEKAWLAHIHIEGVRDGVCEAGRWLRIGWRYDGYHDCSAHTFQAAHLRDMTGLGRKESDLDTILLCADWHVQYDQAKGFFRGWPKTERKLWFRARLADARARRGA